MTRDQAIAAIRAANLGDASDRFIKNLLPSLRLIPGSDPKPNASRFGAPAILPKDTPWPTIDARAKYAERLADIEKTIQNEGAKFPKILQDSLHENRDKYQKFCLGPGLPLSLLAILQFHEIDAHLGMNFPPEGTLNFFYDFHTGPWGFDPAHKPGWRVIYTPAGEGTIVAPPENLLALSPEDFQLTLPTRVLFQPIWSIPPDRIAWPKQEVPSKVSKATSYLSRRLRGNVPETANWCHRIGGWPDEVQSEMRATCQLAGHGIYCGNGVDTSDPKIRSLLKIDPHEWQLLLQLDTDETVQRQDGNAWMWGDSGTLYFWITRTDLAACRFDKS
jgi:uncharacterized protein YwqG